MTDLVKAIRGRLASGYIQGAIGGKIFGTPPVEDVLSLLNEVERLLQEYGRVVDKFDDCRAALARRVEDDTGTIPHPPDDDSRDWHAWLIEQSDKAIDQSSDSGHSTHRGDSDA